MSACRYVGRVGGLAVALGVGAAVLGGTAAAWAQDDTGPATAGPAATERSEAAGNAGPAAAQSAPARADGPVTRRTATRSEASAATRGETTPRAAAASPRAAAAVKTVAPERVSPALPAAIPAAAVPVAPATVSPVAAATVSPVAAATVSPAPVRQAAAVPAVDNTIALVIGPSGVPVPKPTYLSAVMELYINPDDPGAVGQLLFTPEGLYPITGVKSLPLNTSVDQGLEILVDALVDLDTNLPGTPTTVFGYSQSAIIGSLLQDGYEDYRVPPETEINFVFVGNEMNPNGGFLSRFPDLNLTSLGIPFYGPTPADAYPTTNYALEYDGFSDFPRYPLNFLSVLNAGMGIIYVHTKYADLSYVTPERVATAIELPVSPGTVTQQRYFFMPTENLPLLEPFRAIPFIGNPLADLVQPLLKVIVDLGYADPAHGFATAVQPDANVLVPFGLFPQVSPLEVLGRLVEGVAQGLTDFVAAFGPGGSLEREINAIRLPAPPAFALPSPDDLISVVQNTILGIGEAVSGSLAAAYAALLPTADIINAIVTVLPAYSVALVLESVKQILAGDVIGGLINAVGLPIAANVGLITTASLVGVLVWAQAIAGILGVNIPGT